MPFLLIEGDLGQKVSGLGRGLCNDMRLSERKFISSCDLLEGLCMLECTHQTLTPWEVRRA